MSTKDENMNMHFNTQREAIQDMINRLEYEAREAAPKLEVCQDDPDGLYTEGSYWGVGRESEPELIKFRSPGWLFAESIYRAEVLLPILRSALEELKYRESQAQPSETVHSLGDSQRFLQSLEIAKAYRTEHPE